jgi:hypothetical protein
VPGQRIVYSYEMYRDGTAGMLDGLAAYLTTHPAAGG